MKKANFVFDCMIYIAKGIQIKKETEHVVPPQKDTELAPVPCVDSCPGQGRQAVCPVPG